MKNISRWQQIKTFFTLENKKLVAYVRSLIDDTAERDAEDIVQDVAFRLFEKGNITEPIEHIGAFVYQALRNRVVDSFRRKRNQYSLDKPINEEENLCLADIIEDTADDLRIQVERDDLYRKALSIISQLSARERELIFATEVEGYSFAELAENWNVPIGTLLSQKSRSVRKVRERLQQIINNQN